MPSSNPLPPKENALFKRILKCYEQKQYKNGLKFAKQILSNPKFQEHGETLAMKGLTLNNLGRKEEAYDYVRRGLRADLRSHVCWHVYGLLQRSDKKYDEAIKCYRNALKWDNDNIQILRDLSLLQIQMRDLDGYKETRYQLFQLRPTQRASWIGFAMSYHLLNDYDMALKILEEFRKTQQGVNREVVGQVMQALYNKKAAYDYEHSELLLYQNMVLQEAGNTEQALEHLDTYQHQICDKVALLETRAKFYMKIQKDKSDEEQKKLQSKAADIYRGLIKRNPENHDYYTKLAEAVDAKSEEKHLAIYAEYRKMFPKAQAPQRLPMNVANGDSFRELVDAYLKKALRKGVPPLFVDLRPLYKDPQKAAIIEELCLNYANSLKSDEESFEAGGEKEPATALLWVYYYLAQHYDHKEEYGKAFEMVEAAITHTPTLIELFLLKGKLYKHVGDIESAVENVDEAQSLDTADRYINCKCAKYMLRANKVKEAEEMCQKFTREGVPAMENLNEMQCMWFQTECALAYQRMDRFGDSLKKCIEVDRHFTEIIEDQFDFHTYCMRKMTLRSYVELLRLEDVLRTHRFFKKAAHCAIGVYLRLYDHPLQDVDDLGELNTENMSPSELKKLRNKQKKAKRKAEAEKANAQQAQQRKEAHNKSHKKGPGGDEELDAPQKDELVPEKLERPDKPLEEALKFLTPLQNLAMQDLDTHFAAFEIYYRKGKPLLMLRSVKRAKLLLEQQSKSDPRMHGCIVRFQKFVTDKMSTFGDAVQKVLMNETKNIFTTKTTRERNEEFIQKHSNEYQHIVEGARLIALLEPEKTEYATNLLCKLDSTHSEVNIKTCSEVHDALVRGDFGKAGKEKAEVYRKKCQEIFQYASKFKDPSTNSSNHNNVTPSNNDIAKQSKVISNSGDPISSKKHVNNSMDIKKSNSKQYSSKSQDKIAAGSGANAQTEP